MIILVHYSSGDYRILLIMSQKCSSSGHLFIIVSFFMDVIMFRVIMFRIIVDVMDIDQLFGNGRGICLKILGIFVINILIVDAI